MREEYDDEIDIDWMGVFVKLLNSWRFIFVVSVAFGLFGIVMALTSPRKYSVTMTLAPEVQTGGASSLSSISSMLGIAAAGSAGSTDALNITLFPEICKSTPFLTGLFPVELTQYVSPQEAREGVVARSVTVFDHMTGLDREKRFSIRSMGWFSRKEPVLEDDGTLDPARLTLMQSRAVEALSKSISASVDKSGITTITVVMDDRLMATQLADTVCRRLQEYVTVYRTQKSIEDYDYYVKMTEDAQARLVKAQAAYAASVDHERDIILQSVSSRRDRLRQEAELASQLYIQMAQQQEMARAKIQEVKPVFAVIQPATMPQHATNSRAKVVLIWGFVGLFLSCFWVGFGVDLLDRFRVCLRHRLSKQTTPQEKELPAPERDVVREGWVGVEKGV